ncbi:efflux RND transporter periplasmic adaptor subunit [Chitinivibrio alkaliphilus]|uniref:Efflux transporter, RND family, MFP subunit n=1 Tax=Chitinivibrio alkaliphilus ACht1 TaxID=1313304 RepID=U7DDJ5_9BACT|nr:efflux RND transporter periplasmic adaptor subunit [Chitinivibrio alkaliphilus]ERP38961.1 efflux transporter, RND family, MFP subunit [Chitinivibrio alkaliphilus ACht1]
MEKIRIIVQKLWKNAIPVLIVLGAVGFFVLMVATRRTPPSREEHQEYPEVTVRRFEKTRDPIPLSTEGVVAPNRRVDISPRVPGEISYVAPQLRTGEPLEKGDVLFRLDPREYHLDLRGAESQVQTAKTQLAREQEEGEIAREQWELFQERYPEAEAGGLALRHPQIAQAQADLKAAKAALDRARLNLEWTVIRAPFRGFAQELLVHEGQVVSSTPVATFYESDTARVSVRLSSRQKGLLNLKTGDSVAVYTDDSVLVNRSATVAGWSRSLDPRSRSLTVDVALPDPLGIDAEGEIPLESFVRVVFFAVQDEGYFRIPRDALVEGKYLRRVVDSTLEFVPVSVIQWDKNDALVRGDFTENDPIVVGSLDFSLEGMRVEAVEYE